MDDVDRIVAGRPGATTAYLAVVRFIASAIAEGFLIAILSVCIMAIIVWLVPMHGPVGIMITLTLSNAGALCLMFGGLMIRNRVLLAVRARLAEVQSHE